MMSSVHPASRGDFGRGRLIVRLWPRWKRIAAVTLAATGLALVLAWLATPLYKGETRLLVETPESIFARADPVRAYERPVLDEKGVTSQVEVILSTDLLKQVARKLDLAGLPEFDEAAGLSLAGRLLVAAGLESDPNEIPAEERVLRSLREKLTVYRVERSRAIVVEMSSESRRLAAEIPNALADAYIAMLDEATTASEREKQLSANLDQMKAASEQAGGGEAVEPRALDREASAHGDLLLKDLRTRAVSSRNDGSYLPGGARIFSRAVLPSEPYVPKLLPIAGVTFAGSFLVMALITLMQELFSGRALRPGPDSRPEPIEEVPLPVADTGPAQIRPILALAPVKAPIAQARPDHCHLARPGLGEIGIERAAEKLIAGGAMRAIFVSPEGDEAAAAAVLVAREVADAGLRVLLLDLTAAGAASQPMLDSIVRPGITDLLVARAQFTEVIHQDHYSDCHVMPVGTADPVRAMRAADRLPIIMESLTTAYDVVVVECGPADAEGIRRLVDDGTEVLVSVIEPAEEVVEATAKLKAGGYPGLTLVTPAGYRPPHSPIPDRSAA